MESEKEAGTVSFSDFDTKPGANKGHEFEVNRATDGEPSGLFITVLGIDSDPYTKLKEKQDRKRLKQVSKLGRAGIDLLYDENKEGEFDLAVACVIGWRHVSGKEMPFDLGPGAPEESKQFLRDYPHVYEQVKVQMNDRANFTPASAKS